MSWQRIRRMPWKNAGQQLVRYSYSFQLFLQKHSVYYIISYLYLEFNLIKLALISATLNRCEPVARGVVKMQGRQSLIDRMLKGRQEELSVTVDEVLMSDIAQERVRVHLESLSKK